MKMSRFFMTVGSFVLAITGIMATKANKKFDSPTSASFSFASHCTRTRLQ